MKKNLNHLLVSFVLLVSAVFSFSCSNSSDSDGEVDVGARGIYLASSYQSLSDYTKKTIQFAGLKYSGRTSSVPKVFIVNSGALASMSEANMLLAVETCAEGNTFIIDAPTKEQVKAFKEKIDAFLAKEENAYHNALQDVHLYSIDNLLFQFVKTGDGSEPDTAIPDFNSNSHEQKAFEAIAMRKNQIYFVHDIDEVFDASALVNTQAEATADYSENNVDTGEKNSESKESVSVAANSTDYSALMEESAENFAQWILLTNSTDAVTQAVSLDDAKKAQSFVHNFTASFSSNRSHYDGRYNGKSENVQIYIDVWVACEIDNKKDHYLVRTSCVCNNGQLGYGNSWDNGKYVGPYFNYAHVTTQIQKASLKSTDCQPQTTTGSSSFATSQGFNFGGNVGFNASGPTGGISGGYSYSETTTQSIPDITIALHSGSNSAYWEYTTPEVNGTWSGLVTKCDGAKTIQHNTAIFDTYAHYTMSSAEYYSQGTFPLLTNAEVSVGMLTGWITGFLGQTLHNGHAYTATSAKWTDYVRKPSNAFKNYVMAFEPPEGMSTSDRALLADALKVYISDWGNNVNYYGIVNTDNPGDYTPIDDIAKSHFAIARKTLENNKKVLKDRGFNGKFKFYIKRSDKSDILTSFDMEF